MRRQNVEIDEQEEQEKITKLKILVEEVNVGFKAELKKIEKLEMFIAINQ